MEGALKIDSTKVMHPGAWGRSSLLFALHILARLMNFLIKQTVCFQEAVLK
jgi:hypothetical protein